MFLWSLSILSSVVAATATLDGQPRMGTRAATTVNATAATWSNVQRRLDTSGAVVISHDGALYFFEGKHVLVGTSYFPCEGFTTCPSYIGDCGWHDNNFSVYTSTAGAGGLWKLESANSLPKRQHAGANFRQKIVRRKADG